MATVSISAQLTKIEADVEKDVAAFGALISTFEAFIANPFAGLFDIPTIIAEAKAAYADAQQTVTDIKAAI